MKATVVNTVANTTNVVELPEAVTDLAGLKRFLSVSDGQFFEGTTHTDLTSDSQALPELPEGKRERGYVFFVSPSQNKIKNGGYSRKECYTLIKARGLQDAVKQEFGRNFTLVSTDALNSFLGSHGAAPDEAVSPVLASAHESAGGITTEKELFQAVLRLFTVSHADFDSLYRLVGEGIDSVFPNPYSVQDLANMRG